MRACCLASRQRRARVRACLRLACLCWRAGVLALCVRVRVARVSRACERARARARACARHACARARARAMRGARAGMRVCAPCVRVCVHAASARARACACASCTCACVRVRARQFNFFSGQTPARENSMGLGPRVWHSKGTRRGPAGSSDNIIALAHPQPVPKFRSPLAAPPPAGDGAPGPALDTARRIPKEAQAVPGVHWQPNPNAAEQLASLLNRKHLGPPVAT